MRPNEWLFSTRLEVGSINEKWGLELPENDNYNTLGGYLLDLHQSIPRKGTVIRSQHYLFIVEKTTANRLEEVLVKTINWFKILYSQTHHINCIIMATIERIRQRSGLLIVVVFVALLAFLLGDLFKSGGSKFFGDPNVIGSVNGIELSRQEVSQKMEELRSGNPETYANTSTIQLANFVWTNFLSDAIQVRS